MTATELNRDLRRFASSDPHAAGRAEYVSVLAAALAEAVGSDPLRARQSALAAFGATPSHDDIQASRVADAALAFALQALDPGHEWAGLLAMIAEKVSRMSTEPEGRFEAP